MYCPSCGTQNSDAKDLRFCRSCGSDLRGVSRAVKRSLPLRVASALDDYFENRHQQNLRNGVLNVVAFIFMLVIAIGYLVSGWTGYGLLMLVLSLIAIVTGVWDIWIYKRNLPPVARKSSVSATPAKEQLPNSASTISLPSVTESTTKQLNLPERKSQ